MHLYIDSEGKRQYNHLMKDCRTFIRLQGAFSSLQSDAQNRGFTGVPGQLALHAPPPPPRSPNPALAIQAAPANHSSQQDGLPPPRGSVNMIQKGRPSNMTQKLITRQVNLVIQAPPPTIEYLDWSE
jgi:hypothetical protein